MAKKKKKVKAGLLRRKQEKKQKQQKQKRNQQPVSQKISMQKMQQSLGKLCLLVFEPEFSKISAKKERIQAIFEKKAEMPLQVMEFVDEFVYKDFLQAIQDVLEKTPASDKLKTLSLQSVLQFMRDEKDKQHMNQLVVAKYYQLLSDYELISEKVTPQNVLQVVADYEKEYSAKLPHYQPQASPQVAGEEQSSEEKVASPMESLHQKVKTRVITVAPKDQLDLIIEDLEMFFTDFLQEKAVSEPEQITSLTLKKFVSYVKQNLNPTPEDLENIATSLEYLRGALHYLKIFDEEMLTKASKISVVEKN
jgi:hypothetical protein